MEQITKIYTNNIGISFFWNNSNDSEKVQLIFKDTGFYLTSREIHHFSNCIRNAKQQERCDTCSAGRFCKSILLRTPSKKVSMAISLDELEQIEDLFIGTLFQLNLKQYLHNLCKN